MKIAIPEIELPPRFTVQYIFLDVVEFTRPERTEEDMVRMIFRLDGIVQGVLAEKKIPNRQLVVIPTGDGMCIGLVKPKDLDLHIQIAMAIRKGVDSWNTLTERRTQSFLLRIAVHEHGDFIVKDFNGRKNILGHGINTAARIMSLCDPGHIVASRTVYEKTHRAHAYAGAYKPSKRVTAKGESFEVFDLGPGLGEGFSLLELVGRYKGRIGAKLTPSDIAKLRVGETIYHTDHGPGKIIAIAPNVPGKAGRKTKVKFREFEHEWTFTNAKGNYHRWI